MSAGRRIIVSWLTWMLSRTFREDRCKTRLCVPKFNSPPLRRTFVFLKALKLRRFLEDLCSSRPIFKCSCLSRIWRQLEFKAVWCQSVCVFSSLTSCPLIRDRSEHDIKTNLEPSCQCWNSDLCLTRTALYQSSSEPVFQKKSTQFFGAIILRGVSVCVCEQGRCNNEQQYFCWLGNKIGIWLFQLHLLGRNKNKYGVCEFDDVIFRRFFIEMLGGKLEKLGWTTQTCWQAQIFRSLCFFFIYSIFILKSDSSRAALHD